MNTIDGGKGTAVAEGGWIEWHGGECPVPAGTRVSVKFRNGVSTGLSGDRVAEYGWVHYGDASDIVAYRISKPAEPPAPDTSAEENRLWHEYAGKAMQGLLACPSTTGTHDGFAKNAADFADAMLAEARKLGRV